MILDPSWLQARPEPAHIVEQVLNQIEDICGSAFSADSHELVQVAEAVNEALSTWPDDVAVDTNTVVGLASQALKAIGETRAGLRLFLFGSGVVKPLEWEIAGGDTLWALDLDYVTLGHGMDCELVLFPAMNSILSAISDVWDESDGHGVLGLLHTRRALRESLGGELKFACDARLARIAASRNWTERPQVLNLDLGIVAKAKPHRHNRRHV